MIRTESESKRNTSNEFFLILDNEGSINKQMFTNPEDVFDVIGTECYDKDAVTKMLSDNYGLIFYYDKDATDKSFNAPATILSGETMYGDVVIMSTSKDGKGGMSLGECIGTSSILSGVIEEQMDKINNLRDKYREELLEECSR